jgi:lipoate-protein ligase A
MAVDAAILRAIEAGEAPPTLRLYGWKPWCVSLGYFQKPERELDAAALRERGWDVVTRPTGGRAVLHTDELTYSILGGKSEAPWCASLATSYEAIGAAWAHALDGFGLDMVRGAPPDLDNRGGGRNVGANNHSPVQNAPAPPCFASSAKSELVFGNRKVVGSAQRRTREAFVQHGSIPVSPDHERLVEVLPLDAAGKAAYLATLRAHAVSLGEITPMPGVIGTPQWAAWERALAARLLDALGVVGEPGALSPAEEAFAAEREAELRAAQAIFLGP